MHTVEQTKQTEQTGQSDPYVQRWAAGVAAQRGPMPGTRLEPLSAGCYRVVLRSETNAYASFRRLPEVAVHLQVDRAQLVFDALGPRDLRLRIMEADAIRGSEYYTGPHVSGGMIRDLGGHLDGQGEFAVRMWDETGMGLMRPVMLVGEAATGCTSAAGTLAVGALSTGVMSLLHVNPTGTGRNPLAEEARVALIGLEAAEQAPVVVEALVRGRLRHLGDSGVRVLRATPGLPGWAIVHDDFNVVARRGRGTQRWQNLAWHLPRLGFWSVMVNNSFFEVPWGSDLVRAGFADQVVSFRLREPSDGLMAGLYFPPRQLPEATGGTVAGAAVQNAAEPNNAGRPNVPGFWHHLPVWPTTDPEAPLTLADALREYAQQVELAAVDVTSLTDLLGPAEDGRWVLGPGGTHELPRSASAA